TNPHGLVAANIEMFRSIKEKFSRKSEPKPSTPLQKQERRKVAPANLKVENLVVRFGGVTAIKQANLSVTPGKIVGLIGPNGAGKSTLIDAVTGFVTPAEGKISLNDEDITQQPVHTRT